LLSTVRYCDINMEDRVRRRPKERPRARSEDYVRIQEPPDSRQQYSDSILYEHDRGSPVTFQSSGSRHRPPPPGRIDRWMTEQDLTRSRNLPQLAIDAVTGLDSREPTIPSSSLTTPTSQDRRHRRQQGRKPSPRRHGAGRADVRIEDDEYEDGEDVDAEGEIDYDVYDQADSRPESSNRQSRDLRGVGAFTQQYQPRYVFARANVSYRLSSLRLMDHVIGDGEGRRSTLQ